MEESMNNILRDLDNDDVDTKSHFFLINCMTDKYSPYQINLNVNGYKMVFEKDMGAWVSIISSDTYLKHFKEWELLPTK